MTTGRKGTLAAVLTIAAIAGATIGWMAAIVALAYTHADTWPDQDGRQ